VRVRYDSAADVLYIAKGQPLPAETDEDEDGLLIRYATADGHICGVTVMGFIEDHWNERVSRLADTVSGYFELPASSINKALIDVTAL